MSRSKAAIPLALVLTALTAAAFCAADEPQGVESAADSPERGSGTEPSAKNSEADSDTGTGDVADTVPCSSHAKRGPPKAGQLVVAPIPFLNPTLDNGLALGVGYLFHRNRQDKVSPISTVAAAYFGTSNSSNGYGGGGKFYLKQDKYRVLAFYAQRNFPSSESGRLLHYSRDYQTYWIDHNYYRSLSTGKVLAVSVEEAY